MLLRLRDSRGDTIVEVLIAIAIVSLTLAGAYTSVNRSANVTRGAQERGEALKWAETQLEQIRATNGTINQTTFCYTPGLTLTGVVPCRTGSGVAYRATIRQSAPGSGNFRVIVQWDSLNTGSTTNNVELDYIK